MVVGADGKDAVSIDNAALGVSSDAIAKAALGQIDGREVSTRFAGTKQREEASLRRQRRLQALEAQRALGLVPDIDDVSSSDTDSTYSVARTAGLTMSMPGTMGTSYGGDYRDPSCGVRGHAAVPMAPHAMTGVLLGGLGSGPRHGSEAAEALARSARLARGAQRGRDPTELAKARRAALQQVGSAVHASGMPFSGTSTGCAYGAFPPGSGFPERGLGPPRGARGRVTGAASRPVPGTYESEAGRQARLLQETMAGRPLSRPSTQERSRRVQQSKLAGALRSAGAGRPLGVSECQREFGPGGLGGSLGDGTRQAARFRPPVSTLLSGPGFNATSEARDAGTAALHNPEGLNAAGHRGPSQRGIVPGRVAPLMEGLMQARRVRLFGDEGAHLGRPTIRTPAQAIETRIRRADRVARRSGGPGLELGRSLDIAKLAAAKRAKPKAKPGRV